MHLFSLDSILYKLYREKWKLDEDESIMTYTPPKLWKLQFTEFSGTNSNELVLFQYPSHYRHKSLFQYDNGFFLYFASIGSVCLIKGLRDFYKRHFKSGVIFSSITLASFLEGIVISRRVKDAKLITLKNGKTLSIKTFQDGEMEYQMDVKDLRIVNKDLANLIILLDVNMARNKKFVFFFLEPSPGCVYNYELFTTVFHDKRYLSYH